MSVGSWANIDSDEEIYVHEHPSKWTLANDVIVGISLVVVAVVLAYRDPLSLDSIVIVGIPGHFWVVIAAIIMSGGMIGISYWERVNTVYLITSKQVYRKEGIFTFSGDPIDVGDVVDKKAEQNFVQQRLGIGDLTIKTAATSELDGNDGNTGYLVFENIPDPIQAKHDLQKAKKEWQKHQHRTEVETKQEYAETQSQTRQDESPTEQPQESLW